MERDIEIDFITENIRLQHSKDLGNCHKNSKIIAEKLRERGYKVRVVTGVYFNFPKVVRHSWIEWEDKILETDCKQLREECDLLPNKPWGVLDKTKFEHRYKTII